MSDADTNSVTKPDNVDRVRENYFDDRVADNDRVGGDGEDPRVKRVGTDMILDRRVDTRSTRGTGSESSSEKENEAEEPKEPAENIVSHVNDEC